MMNNNLPKDAQYYLPHRAPMLLLDELLELHETGCRAKVKIRADMPFLQTQGLPSWVGIEIMAQTIAMYGGILERAKNNQPKLGFLLGCKKFEMGQQHFSIGEELVVDVRLKFFNKQQIGIFECSIQTDQGVSHATLLVAQPDSPQELLPLSKAS